MPSFTAYALLALSAVGALARPASQVKRTDDDYTNCLTYAEAQQVATNYGLLISNYSDALADAVLSPDFTDYSESVNSLINECPQGSAAISLPLLAPTFTNRSMFEMGQSQQPPINFQQLQIWPACSTVVIRWETTDTANITDVKPAVGLIVMETIPAPEGNQFPYYVDTVYSEFDSAAWLSNLQEAGICATASASTSASCGPSATAAPVSPAPVSQSAGAPPAATITNAPVVQSTFDGSIVWVTEIDTAYTTEWSTAYTTVYNK